MRRPSSAWLVACALVISLGIALHDSLAGVGISTPPDQLNSPEIALPPQVTDRPFRYYKLKGELWPLASRDFEFWVSDTYREKGRHLVPQPHVNDNNDVGRLGRILCEDPGNNPFGLARTDISLIYDYLYDRAFAGRDTVYRIDPSNPGFLIAAYVDSSLDEAKHVDLYIHTPASICTSGHAAFDPAWCDSETTYLGDDAIDGVVNSTMYPSPWQWASEDSATGQTRAFHENSVSIPGPQLGVVTQTGSAWSVPDGGANWTALHEFTHCLNNHTAGVFSELQGMASEALAGELPAKPRYDDRYIRSLLWISDRNRIYQNYEGGRGLMTYLAYNFRGSDLGGSDAGIRDDLLFRWGRFGIHRFGGLAQRLAAETASYFQGLAPHDRLQVLIQNWRVANYVNKSSLAEGQYGYPAQFGFRPDRDLGSWKDNDGIPENNAQSIPPEARMFPDTTLRVFSELRGSAGCSGCTWPMRIQPLGAEYWVVSADQTMEAVDQTLQVVARVTDPCGTTTQNGRLMMSAILYSQRSDTANTLWRHPEWATGVIGPVWAEFKAGPSMPVEIKIPSFGYGSGPKSAVIVLSHGDGNELYWSGAGSSGGGKANWDTCVTDTTCPGSPTYEAALVGYVPPYPKQPYYSLQLQTITPIAEDPAKHSVLPTWSPNGNELAFQHDPGTGPRIYRRSAFGGASAPLQSATGPQQLAPDWSPHGDWIVFNEQDASVVPAKDHLWLYNRYIGTKRQLTFSSPSTSQEIMGAFSPNGQQVAYLRHVDATTAMVSRVNLDGSGDVALATVPMNTYFPRWSPLADSIYYMRFGGGPDTVFAVSISGGAPVVKQVRDCTTPGYDIHTGRFDFSFCADTIMACALGAAPVGHIASWSPTGTKRVIPLEARVPLAFPRWSPDGMRVAYSAGTTDQDLYHLRVATGAPSLGVLSDITVIEGQPLNFDLSATDPNGDAITFSDVPLYRPPGATFNSAGQFRWSNAQSAGSVYHVVFRAKDPDGLVSSKVITITVESGAGGGCPFLDTRTASGWEVENSILNRSPTGADVADAYRLKHVPDVENGRYQLRIRENEREWTTLDQVRLVTVDHAPEQRAWANGNRVILGRRQVVHKVRTSNGEDITDRLRDGGADFFVGEPHETLHVDLLSPEALGAPTIELEALSGEDLDPFEIDPGGKGGEGGGGLAASELEGVEANVDATVLATSGILIQGQTSDGMWQTVRKSYPREDFDPFFVDTLDQGPVRVVFVGRHKLRSISRIIPTKAVVPHDVEMLSARHSRLGDVHSVVQGADATTAMLAPGDTIALEFAASPVPEGLVRDYFLLSRGKYSSSRPITEERAQSNLPTQFALLQNQPNPFAQGTHIRFDLPRGERVKLEVFDLQGRLVRILTDRVWEAGSWNVEWDCRGPNGRQVRPGVYLYRIKAGAYRAQRKMTVLP